MPNQRRLEDLRNALNATHRAPENFAEFAREWRDNQSHRWKASQLETVNGILDGYLIPGFDNCRVVSIDRRALLAFRAWLARQPGRGRNETLSAQRANHVLSVLNGILDEAAVQFDWANPLHSIKRLHVPKTDVMPFSLDEVQQILAHVRSDFRAYFTVRFFTGLRTGEIDGLQWRYVDFERAQIRVRETFVRGAFTTPKTPASRRDVQMSAPVKKALRDQFQVTGERGGLVFPNTRSKPLSHSNVRNRIWQPLLEELGFEKRPPYQTRHTAATLWLAAGENPEWIARQMGHTSTEMLFDIYARYVPNLTRRDGSAMEALLDANGLV
ncbi:phage integrase [Salinisphaera dokdonensis CL-ES53]|uniref:Phage integrase n=2 Tax=Salinisphaera TaxID=180541 RepID=A0ABV2AYX4_9GAMM